LYYWSGGTATAPWIQYTPVSRSGDGGLLSLLGCELVACWLLPALKRSHDLYARYVCCIVPLLSDSHPLWVVGLVHVVRCWSIHRQLQGGDVYCCDTVLWFPLYRAMLPCQVRKHLLVISAHLPEFLVQPCVALLGMAPGGPDYVYRCAALQGHPGCRGGLLILVVPVVVAPSAIPLRPLLCCVLHATHRHSQMFMWYLTELLHGSFHYWVLLFLSSYLHLLHEYV
jgi:hypothetical protein